MVKKLSLGPPWPFDEILASSYHRFQATDLLPVNLTNVDNLLKGRSTTHSSIKSQDGALSSNKNQIPINGDHFNNEIILFNLPKCYH